MKKISKWIVKHKILIVIMAFILLIPSFIGMCFTKINYDILIYLPKDIETIQGQNILKDDFHIGAFAFVMIDNMDSKDVLEIEEKIKNVESVNMVFSDSDITGVGFPSDLIPEEVLNKIENDDSKLMLVTFRESTSDEATLNAIDEIRKIVSDSAKVGGMSARVLDTSNLSNSEMSTYVIVAVILCMIVLLFATDSYMIPLFLLGNIGIAIVYNLGTNIFLGQISYITKAISAVLQLGVTMDFSIFLYHKYEYQRGMYEKEEAMQKAIVETFKSVFGSSLTTIAGFLALCFMELTLGMDIGIVMAKGVFLGLVSVLTILPAFILTFDKAIEKTKHKSIFPKFKALQRFSLKYYKLIFVLFLLLLIPAWYGNRNVKVYYNLEKSLPSSLGSSIANLKLKTDYNLVSPEMIILNQDLKTEDLDQLIDELKEVEGIDLVLSPKEIFASIPDFMLPDDLADFVSSNGYQMIIINSLYENATTELNEQITTVDKIVKKYDAKAIVAGEGPLMKDLTQISDQDFKNVNYSSIFVIFILMLFTLKSISLPVLLVFIIEAAIYLNMSCSFFTGSELPFIASIVIGTIQLGATIDYAILMSTTYLDFRCRYDKKEAMSKTLEHTVPSIIVSAMCFFAATIGVGVISKIDMIASICTLLSRGSLISMAIVVLVLPSVLLIFDKVVMKTTLTKKEG